MLHRLQPPTRIHQVYTLENSIFTGGHFMMLDDMHLTEITRVCAAYTSQSLTNASHQGCIRLLGRIALAILFDYRESGEFHNRDLTSQTETYL